MPENPIDAALAPQAAPAGGNPIDDALSAPTNSPSSAPQRAETNPVDAALGDGGASENTSQQTQSSGPEESVGDRFSKALNEPGKGVLGHIWGVINTPFVDIDSALGRSGQAGGVEKGANDLASGLTSPLSIALTLGTLGMGGLVESGGMSVLRAAGLAAPEIADVARGAKILDGAIKAGKTAEEGMTIAKTAGVDTDALSKGLQTLKEASLQPDSLLSKGLARNVGTAVASKLGAGTKAADSIGQGFQALTSAGFTLQQAQQAAELSPKVLDALRDGDYETAKRLGIDALGSAVLGGLAAHEFAKESSGLMSDISAKAGLKVKPSQENLQLSNNFGEFDKNVTQAGRTAELWAQDLRKEYPKMSPGQLERVRYYLEAGLDEDKLAQRHNVLAEAAGRDTRLPVEDSSDPVSSGISPERLNEVVSGKHLAERYSPEEVDSLLDAYDPSKLSDADKELAKKIRSKFNDTLEYSRQNDALKDGIEDYVSSIWKKDEGNNPAANNLKHEASTGTFNTYASMARSRVFDNAFEGQLFGKKLAETDPITLAAHNSNVFARVVEARKAIERLADKGARSSEGRPFVTLSGDAHAIPDDNVMFVNPKGVRSIKISDHVVQGLKDSGDLERLVSEGKIKNLTRTITSDNIDSYINRLEQSAISAAPKFDEEGNVILRRNIETLKAVRDGKLPKSALDQINAQRPNLYAWDHEDYGHVDHPALKDWNHVGQSPSGDSVLMKGDMLVHPEAMEYLKRRLGVDSQGPLDNPVGKALMKANTESKGLTLSLSPFHIAQIGLRGVMSGVSPFKMERWDLANDPVLAHGVENGLTLKNYNGKGAFSEGTLEGHSALLDKIPGLRTIQNGMNKFLFQKYIPSIKASTYKELFERYKEAYPDWTADKAAAVAADDTNARYGGINYKKLGRAAATQNWFKMLTLAPDWLEGEVRSIVRPFGLEGKIARQDMARITAYMWLGARMANLVSSGHPHLEAPFGVVYKQDNGKDAVISMRSLPADLLHAVSDPYNFIRGRVSPVAHTAAELYSGRDSFGRKLSREDLAVDMFRNTLPIPTQAIGKRISGMSPETGNVGQVVGALGGTDTIYRTEASKLAAQIASDHSESGPVDQSQLARHQTIMHIEDQLRAGQIKAADLQQLRITGQLPESDYKRVMQNYTKTRGMTADMAQLYTRAQRIPAQDLFKVWDASTSSEKQLLLPILQAKGSKYIKTQLKEATPTERMSDPVLARYMRLEARMHDQPQP